MILKQKLAYMAVGAVIASFGYFIGTLNNLNADDEVARVKKLIVSESITVVNEDDTVSITPGYITVSHSYADTHIRSGGIEMGTKKDAKSCSLHIGVTSELIYRNLRMGVRDLADTFAEERKIDQPIIEMRKTDGERIILQVADEASIKLSNGGLKSKTITVD